MRRVFDCLRCARNQARPCNLWKNHGKPDSILNCPDYAEDDPTRWRPLPARLVKDFRHA